MIKKLLYFIAVFSFYSALAQPPKTALDQLQYVNKQWQLQADIPAILKNAPATFLTEKQLIQFHLEQTENLLRRN